MMTSIFEENSESTVMTFYLFWSVLILSMLKVVIYIKDTKEMSQD